MSDLALLPLIGFCLVATGTPGPNNMINLAQGVRVGFWRAYPFALGTGIGLAAMLTLAGAGLAAAFADYPWLHMGMKALTVAFILYLAWMLVTAGPIGETADGAPVGLLGGMLFQWINPKSWFAVLSIATTYLPADADWRLALLAGGALGLTAALTQPVWILFGAALRRLLQDARRARAFFWAMAALLLASTLPVLIGGV